MGQSYILLSQTNSRKLHRRLTGSSDAYLSDKIKSINTAKKYLTELESLGLLGKEKVGKEFIWFNTELMNILSD